EELHRLYQARSLAFLANVGAARQVNAAGRLGRVTHTDGDLHYLQGGYAVPRWTARWAGVESGQESRRVLTGFATSIAGRGRSGTVVLHRADALLPEEVRARTDA